MDSIEGGVMERFHGAIVAIITPFINGSLDEQGLVDLIEFQIAQAPMVLSPAGQRGSRPPCLLMSINGSSN